MHLLKKFLFNSPVIKESSTRARVTDPDFANDTKSPSGCIFVSAHDHGSTRTHMFLFADHSWIALAAEVGKSFRWVFQESGLRGRFRGRHRGRQINQPFWVC